MSEDAYGPPLPPGFSKQPADTSSEDEDTYGPSLPPSKASDDTCGPSLPPSKASEDTYGPSLPPSKASEDTYGSSLPPSKATKPKDKNISHPSIGPSLPLHLVNKYKQNSDSDEPSDIEAPGGSIGPVLPPHLSKHKPAVSSEKVSSSVYGPVVAGSNDSEENSDDEYLVGPSISMKTSGQESSALEDFESRAQKMRDKLTGKDDGTEEPQGRESWMTELPPEMGASFGLTSRTFRKNAAQTGDRSCWTDTPADKEKKQREGHKRKRSKEEGYIPTEKDKQTAEEIEAYNKANRPDSLLEMHQKKRKKKKKKEKEKSKERRPFDRDLDLQVNRLDEAQRKAIIKRSQELGSRFKSGGMGTSFL